MTLDEEKPAEEQPGPSSGERLEVRFELTEADALVGYFQGFLGHPLVRKRLPVVIFFLLTMQYGLAVVAGPSAAVAVLAAVVFGFGFLLPAIVRLQARKNDRLRGPHTAWITPEGIGGWTEGVGTTRVVWPLVKEVGGTRTHILVFWQVGATTLIPRSAFASPEEADAFLETARQWHRAGLAADRSEAAPADAG